MVWWGRGRVCGVGELREGVMQRIKKDAYRSGTRKGGDAGEEWLWRMDKS